MAKLKSIIIRLENNSHIYSKFIEIKIDAVLVEMIRTIVIFALNNKTKPKKGENSIAI